MSKYAGFSSVQMTRPTRSQFDLSHYKRLTTRMGRLTPVFLTECVPSDTFRGSSEILVRVAPLLAPIYDNLILFVHFFFIPNRLLWSEWETFITGGRLGVGIDPLEAPIPPFVDLDVLFTEQGAVCDKSMLPDYLGVPPNMFAIASPGEYAGINLDVMPFLAYQKVYMDYYRDRNFLSDDIMEFPIASGDIDDISNWEQFFQLRTRAYEHDYFTSALPFVQRGEQVLIPLDGSVTYLQTSQIRRSDTGVQMTNNDLVMTNNDALTNGGNAAMQNAPGVEGVPVRIENIDSISNGTSTINDFRAAYALQVWLERNAVGGSRYNESTQAHFGVKPQDERLQRPEYIGGGRIPIKISEIVSTAYSTDADDAVIPLANLAGHGITYGNTNRFNYFCVEHGFIIGIASIMNTPSYHQGLPKMFRRRSFLDYPWPTFAKLGEQQVDKAEIFASPLNLTEDADGILPLFGYQSRYADWKFIAPSNHGDFHDSLLFWTLTRDFGAPGPELGQTFVEFDSTTQDRIFAVPQGDNFWLYINNQISVKRPLPYFGTPNTLGFV